MKKSGIQIKKSLLGGIGTIGNTLKNKGNFLKQKFTNIIKKTKNKIIIKMVIKNKNHIIFKFQKKTMYMM